MLRCECRLEVMLPECVCCVSTTKLSAGRSLLPHRHGSPMSDILLGSLPGTLFGTGRLPSRRLCRVELVGRIRRLRIRRRCRLTLRLIDIPGLCRLVFGRLLVELPGPSFWQAIFRALLIVCFFFMVWPLWVWIFFFRICLLVIASIGRSSRRFIFMFTFNRFLVFGYLLINFLFFLSLYFTILRFCCFLLRLSDDK